MEHQTFKACCPCGRTYRSTFPAEVAAPVQYGPLLKALVVLLTQHHMLPFERTAELLFGLLGLTLSPATIETFVIEAASRLTPTVSAIAAAVTVAPVINVDETGMRVAGKLKWLHVAVTQALAWMGIHARRGLEAMTEFGILPKVEGILVHDGWKPYATLDQCEHALCNAHIVRDLTFVHEVFEQGWAKRMMDFLPATNKLVRQAAGQPLPEDRQAELRRTYDGIVAGCFRTLPGAERFCTIRSYLVTLSKQGCNLLDALVSTMRGTVPRPDLSSL